MVNVDSHSQITPEQVEAIKILAEMAEEIATANDSYRAHGKTKLGLDRIEELVKLAAEIIKLMSEKVKDGSEARFVSDFVRGAVYHWNKPKGSSSQRL